MTSWILSRKWVLYAIGFALSAAFIFGSYKYVKHTGDATGYARCQMEDTAAALQAQLKARTQIIDIGKQYEPIKTQIIHVKEPNDIVAPRVDLAIDRMPEPHTNNGKRSK